MLVHASLFERAPAPDGTDDGLGFNTAILVAPDGELLAHTRKTHIPVTAGYYEDKYFRQGPAEGAYPVHEIRATQPPRPGHADVLGRVVPRGGPRLRPRRRAGAGLPDRDRLGARPPRLRHPAAVAVLPIVGHAIANGLFVVVPNRYGTEGLITFYGSSFIADPYGRVLVQAPRDEAAVLVADLDSAQGRD